MTSRPTRFPRKLGIGIAAIAVVLAGVGTTSMPAMAASGPAVVAQTTVAPLVISAPVLGSTVTTGNPVISGAAEPGALVGVEAENRGGRLGFARADATGAWSFEVAGAPLSDGHWEALASQFVDGVPVGDSARLSFTVDTTPAMVLPVVVRSPAANAVLTTATPTFTGTATVGSTVLVKQGSGQSLGKATVAQNGEWSILANHPLPDGKSTLTVMQLDGRSAPVYLTVDVQAS